MDPSPGGVKTIKTIRHTVLGFHACREDFCTWDIRVSVSGRRPPPLCPSALRRKREKAGLSGSLPLLLIVARLTSIQPFYDRLCAVLFSGDSLRSRLAIISWLRQSTRGLKSQQFVGPTAPTAAVRVSTTSINSLFVVKSSRVSQLV